MKSSSSNGRLKHRNSSLYEVESRKKVRKRLEEYRRRADAKFKREKKKYNELKHKVSKNKLKIKKRTISSDHPGIALFRSATRNRTHSRESIAAVLNKRLVSDSVFHKGKVTQVKTKGRKRVGKLDPKFLQLPY